ncbi:MAG: peptidylprolyl isomerase [Candidatus Limnocylindria bacterium]
MMARAAPARAVPALAACGLALAACVLTATPSPKPPCPESAPTANAAQVILEGAELAEVVTNKGTFTLELYPDAAPVATANFVALAHCGFYDGISFHRVLAGFVIQAGDPQTKANRGDFAGIGTGGPGYGFEIEPPADELTYDPYVVSMANDEVANGSQFFIDLVDLDDQLDRAYTILGKVIEGTSVVDAIGLVPVGSPRGVPLDPVIIESITIRATPAASPSP